MKKKIALMAGLIALTFSLTTGAARAEDDDTYTVHNKTGEHITEFYFQAAGEDDWTADLLGGDGWDNGESGEVTFDAEADDAEHDGDDCTYDLKIVTEDGDSYELEGLNLCEDMEFALELHDGKLVAVEGEGNDDGDDDKDGDDD